MSEYTCMQTMGPIGFMIPAALMRQMHAKICKQNKWTTYGITVL